MKKFPMNLTQSIDEFEDSICRQELTWNYDDFKGSFYVQNLWDCPEDAIIGRDLFTAEDFIWAIKLGMALGHKGYDDIELNETETTI